MNRENLSAAIGGLGEDEVVRALAFRREKKRLTLPRAALAAACLAAVVAAGALAADYLAGVRVETYGRLDEDGIRAVFGSYGDETDAVIRKKLGQEHAETWFEEGLVTPLSEEVIDGIRSRVAENGRGAATRLGSVDEAEALYGVSFLRVPGRRDWERDVYRWEGFLTEEERADSAWWASIDWATQLEGTTLFLDASLCTEGEADFPLGGELISEDSLNEPEIRHLEGLEADVWFVTGVSELEVLDGETARTESFQTARAYFVKDGVAYRAFLSADPGEDALTVLQSVLESLSY